MAQAQTTAELDALETRFDGLSDWVESIETQLERVRQENRELHDEVDRLDEENRKLRARLQEVENSNSLLAKAKQAELSSPEERAVACIQKLKNKADATGADRVAIDQEAGWEAVEYAVDRTTVYDIFRKAEKLLGRPDVLWYQSESRSSEKNSRLILDRSEGDLPESVAGHTVSDVRGASTTPNQGDGGAQSGENRDSTTNH